MPSEPRNTSGAARTVYANPDLPQGAVDRDAYVACVLEQLHRALNNRDVFAAPSHRWSNPRARLLAGAEWDGGFEDVLADIARLSPLRHRNLNLLGRCSFNASDPAAGALRPLRDPDAPDLEGDDGGGHG
ncbi:hypothetical protein [Streptomyces sp. NPDC046759]|uniref:hypothetical protein n=1 Tax=Streptomyces sp. NPDC046759 TaxID=3155019 RepID=UPI0033D37737